MIVILTILVFFISPPFFPLHYAKAIALNLSKWHLTLQVTRQLNSYTFCNLIIPKRRPSEMTPKAGPLGIISSHRLLIFILILSYIVYSNPCSFRNPSATSSTLFPLTSTSYVRRAICSVEILPSSCERICLRFGASEANLSKASCLMT